MPSLQRNFPHKMEAQKPQSEKPRSVDQAMASCRKKKSEEASFLEDLRDHMDEFINASMDEHKSCFKKTIQKVSRRTLSLGEVMNLSATYFLVYVSDVWNVKECCTEDFRNQRSRKFCAT